MYTVFCTSLTCCINCLFISVQVQSEYQRMMEKAKMEGSNLSKLLDVVGAAQSKALDSGAQSLEACRMGVWHLHRKLESRYVMCDHTHLCS